jgi:ferredoxin-NADP reductase
MQESIYVAEYQKQALSVKLLLIMLQPLLITDIITETTAARTFLLQPQGGMALQYNPGQFLTLVFSTAFGEKRRSYSFSSSPLLNELPAITVKRVANGEFSRLLLDHYSIGNMLYTSGVSGLFQLPPDTTAFEQYFFLAAGSGITPCFSLIKTLLSATQKKVVLIYSNREAADAIFLKQLLQLQQQYINQFKLKLLYSNSPDVYSSRLSNWLLQQLLQQYLQVPKAKALFYLCGPYEYMQMATITLLNEGIPAAHIRKENFNSLPRVARPMPPDTQLHNVTINTRKQTYTIPVQYPDTILAASKKAGIPIPYSCEAGRCGSCVATCISGKVWMAYNEVLLDEEIAMGRVLCCQGYPVGGDVEVVV